LSEKKSYKFIYGPVSSWRLGVSLGIDPVYTGMGKVCSFDCIYCQAGKTRHHIRRRKRFVETRDIIREMESLPSLHADYVTLSGAGEPTLALNLGEIISWLREKRGEKIAVLTNSTLFQDASLRKDLLKADLVVAKLDAASEAVFKKVNVPVRGVTLKKVIAGIKKFKKNFRGKLALQVMFLKENAHEARAIANIAREIKPDIVQINTPTRPSRSMALPPAMLKKIEKEFKGLKTVNVYEAEKKKVTKKIKSNLMKRRGKPNA